MSIDHEPLSDEWIEREHAVMTLVSASLDGALMRDERERLALLGEVRDRRRARRGDEFEAYIKRRRDSYPVGWDEWFALDHLLDGYRLHADTGTPLSEDVAE